MEQIVNSNHLMQYILAYGTLQFVLYIIEDCLLHNCYITLLLFVAL